jgi:hypothetical protein
MITICHLISLSLYTHEHVMSCLAHYFGCDRDIDKGPTNTLTHPSDLRNVFIGSGGPHVKTHISEWGH